MNNNQIVESYNNGESIRQISKKMHTSATRISNILKLCGVTVIPSNQPFSCSEILRDNIIKDYQNNKENLSALKIAIKYGINEHNVYKILQINKIKTKDKRLANRKYFIENENYFETIDTPNKAYLLGLMYSDGYITKYEGSYLIGIGLQERDSYIIEKLKEEIGAEKPIRTQTIEKQNCYKNSFKCSQNIKSLSLNSKKLFNDLNNAGCFQRKSLKLMFPMEWQVSKDLLKYFILGYFDGDGSVFVSNNRVNFYFLGTLNMCQNIRKHLHLLLDFPIKMSIYKKGKIFKLLYTGNIKSKIFSDFFYKDTPLFLKRKREVFNRINNEFPLSKRKNHKSLQNCSIDKAIFLDEVEPGSNPGDVLTSKT